MGETATAGEVAALYVIDGGPYFNLPGVDPWPEVRDARQYDGPNPVVAHPPCARWGRYWFGGPSVKVRKKLGDDAGCFSAALASVRRWGGVLEHPEGSHAWRYHALTIPPQSGGWVQADPLWDQHGGWTCCVAQGHYGHRAQKLTWLYAVGCELPDLIWGRCEGMVRLDDGYHSAEERAAAKADGVMRGGERLSRVERKATPGPFRDLLLSIARSARTAGNPRGRR